MNRFKKKSCKCQFQGAFVPPWHLSAVSGSARDVGTPTAGTLWCHSFCAGLDAESQLSVIDLVQTDKVGIPLAAAGVTVLGLGY